jgi:hypothetical protein
MTGATLSGALALAAHAVGPHADAAVPGGDDPLRLDLPSFGSSPGDLPSPAAVRVFASLYLASELEQAGVVAIAELLASERDSLNLTSYGAAARLDAFSTSEHQWYDRAARVQLYARLFGTGPGATNDAGSLANREFVSLLASLCRALATYARLSPQAGAVAGIEVAVEEAAQALLENVASRVLGNTLVAARRIEDQLRQAVDILRDPTIGALVGARTLQQTILAILGKDAPDVQRLIDAGTAGQQVVEWLADALPRLSSAQHVAVMTLGDPISVTAVRWLDANGLPEADQQTMPQAA